mmetsp:Transcript_10025/g.33117  ORF Transcript_10025/g.33117 Transcript_10025/m.33117 type:complete len:215 (-) Transcript_10025:561-1205(-)|eukprot:scaffold28332_cov138-Isochrysis_galbana.AAC.5
MVSTCSAWPQPTDSRTTATGCSVRAQLRPKSAGRCRKAIARPTSRPSGTSARSMSSDGQTGGREWSPREISRRQADARRVGRHSHSRHRHCRRWWRDPFETARRQATRGFFLLTSGHLSRSASLLASSSAPRADVGAIPTPKPCRAVHAAIPRFNDAAYRLQDFSQQSAGAAELRVQLRPLTMRPVAPCLAGSRSSSPDLLGGEPGGCSMRIVG